MRYTLLVVLSVLAPCRAKPPGDAQSPYVDQLASPVRGLTAREVDDLLNGRGAGFARTAELNGYAGPRHVLDMGDHLTLSAEQRTRIEAIFAAMDTDAKRLGAEIVDRERALAAAFAQHLVSSETLAARVDTLGTLYARLRARHLAAHVETTALLTPEQIGRYNDMRGYGGDISHAH